MANKKFKTDEKVVTQVRSWEVGKSGTKGTPYVRVKFDHYIDWTGWLTTKTMERTLNTLAILGFNGANLGMLKHDDALDKTKEFSAVIDEARDYQGKWYHSAKFINSVFEGGFSGDMDDDIADIDCRAYIADAVEDNQPASSGYGSDAYSAPDGGFTCEEIPF